MPPNPKEIKKLEADIQKRKDGISATEKLQKKWDKLTGPMSPQDEKILASGAHGVHGKVKYEQAVKTLETNLAQARNELTGVEHKLAEERAKK